MSSAEEINERSSDLTGRLPRRWREARETPFSPQLDSLNDAFAGIDYWQRASQIATVGLFVLVVGVIAKLAESVLVPVILAWVVATILLPVVERMAKTLPRGLAAITMAVAVLLVLATLIALLSVPVTYWVGRASELSQLIRDRLHTLSQPMTFLEELGKALAQLSGTPGPALAVREPSPNMVTTILAILTPAVSQFVLFFFALIFYLIYQQDIRTSTVFFFRDRGSRLTALRILKDIDRNVSTYFGTFTIINVCLGAATALLTYAVGLPNPLLWGVFAAVLNFIPYIGVAIVMATLFVVGLLTFASLGEAVVAPLAYVAITTLEGQFLTPTILGHRLTMNPFLVFLSIAFWTWMWGPIGAFLAVPLAMGLSVAGRHLFAEDKPELPD